MGAGKANHAVAIDGFVPRRQDGPMKFLPLCLALVVAAPLAARGQSQQEMNAEAAESFKKADK